MFRIRKNLHIVVSMGPSFVVAGPMVLILCGTRYYFFKKCGGLFCFYFVKKLLALQIAIIFIITLKISRIAVPMFNAEPGTVPQ